MPGRWAPTRLAMQRTPAEGGRCGPRGCRSCPALLTLAVTLWGIGSASFWRDEAATLTATRRSLPEMIRMLTRVDAVHGAYYLLMWPLAHLFGTSEFVMRLPSAIAMAAAAFGTAVIGRRLGSPRTGLLAGLVLAVAADDEQVRPGGAVIRAGDSGGGPRELSADPGHRRAWPPLGGGIWPVTGRARFPEHVRLADRSRACPHARGGQAAPVRRR